MLAPARRFGRVGAWANERLPLSWLGLAAGATAFGGLVPFACPFRSLTGWDCPICGGTRAVDSLSHLHLLAALRDNLAIVLLGCLLILNLFPGVRTRSAGQHLGRFLNGDSALIWVSLIVGWTVFRNLPGLIWLSPDR